MMLALMVHMYGVPMSHIFNLPSISIEIPSIIMDIQGISNQNLVHRTSVPGLSPTEPSYLVNVSINKLEYQINQTIV